MSEWNPLAWAVLLWFGLCVSWCGVALIVAAVVLPLRRRRMVKRSQAPAPLPQRRRPRPAAPPLSRDGEPLTAGEIQALRGIEHRLEDDLRKERHDERRPQ